MLEKEDGLYCKCYLAIIHSEKDDLRISGSVKIATLSSIMGRLP